MNAIVNDESEIRRKETTLIYFNVLCGNLCYETKKKEPLKISEQTSWGSGMLGGSFRIQRSYFYTSRTAISFPKKDCGSWRNYETQFKNCQTRTVAGILVSHRAFVIVFVCRLTDVLCKGRIRWDATRRLAVVREVQNRYQGKQGTIPCVIAADRLRFLVVFVLQTRKGRFWAAQVADNDYILCV